MPMSNIGDVCTDDAKFERIPKHSSILCDFEENWTFLVNLRITEDDDSWHNTLQCMSIYLDSLVVEN